MEYFKVMYDSRVVIYKRKMFLRLATDFQDFHQKRFHLYRYIKFAHNVALNALASIYFHNYLRFDEMPTQQNDTQGLML